MVVRDRKVVDSAENRRAPRPSCSDVLESVEQLAPESQADRARQVTSGRVRPPRIAATGGAGRHWIRRRFKQTDDGHRNRPRTSIMRRTLLPSPALRRVPTRRGDRCRIRSWQTLLQERSNYCQPTPLTQHGDRTSGAGKFQSVGRCNLERGDTQESSFPGHQMSSCDFVTQTPQPASGAPVLRTHW
jgi:hypothetical protein